MVNPERGDIIWVNFDPRLGHEQSGVRPALVLSLGLYNRFGLCIVCPITSHIKGYAFEVVLDEACFPIRGAVLANQVTTIDWRSRSLEKPGANVGEEILDQVTHFVSGLVSGK